MFPSQKYFDGKEWISARFNFLFVCFAIIYDLLVWHFFLAFSEARFRYTPPNVTLIIHSQQGKSNKDFVKEFFCNDAPNFFAIFENKGVLFWIRRSIFRTNLCGDGKRFDVLRPKFQRNIPVHRVENQRLAVVFWSLRLTRNMI